ncbi:hypothetical protein F4808DRAFT_410756 [Astrocystis sublimbata]|nr:hypothetical protein F4808DRAFT_410756 [Astrocystis sublimbata]
MSNTITSVAYVDEAAIWLVKALAQALPEDYRCAAWHLSTTPAITDALCYPPALNASTEKRPSKPLKTYCEKHFLAVSINNPETAKDVLVLALEVYIYTTSFSTTIFVAKADSTGYLHLQPAPRGFSPIRAITVAFLDFLIEHRARPSKLLVVNLFARAQSQYIFPGSVKNDQKHILDDRGLTKWWCRVLNPLLENNSCGNPARDGRRTHGYLVIPGLDDYETRAFIPRTGDASRNWSLGHPLELISPYTKDAANYGKIPPRCLIPTYPDDPKARFVEELEDTTSEKAKLLEGWKTPKTLDQFWDMMAFRQECSSGRMTGFVWLVFEPSQASTAPKTANNLKSDASLEIPTSSTSESRAFASAKLPSRKRKGKTVLKGPIIPREPRIKTNHVKYPPRTETPYYYWPEAGRGRVVLDDAGYKRAVELLLHLEFKSLEHATASTSRWTNEVNMGENWSVPVIGQKDTTGQTESSASTGAVNNLSGLVLRKRKTEDEAPPGESNTSAAVQTLGGGLVRKKVKVDADDKGAPDTPGATNRDPEPAVNMLGSGFIRKKPKSS